MKIVKVGDIELHLNNKDGVQTAEVALLYGVTPQAIREHKRNHSDELIENVHFFYENKETKGGIQKMLLWTLEGIHIIGFFIRSKRAAKYRAAVAKLLAEIKKGNAQVVAAGCKADQIMTPRIMAYKANLSKKNKQIEELRWELAAAHNKIKELEAKSNPQMWFVEHNLIDLAGELARHNQLLKSAATTLEIIAKDLHQSADHANFFLDNILKHYPKAKENVERIKKHFRRFYG